MKDALTINARIIDALYREALLLSDEVRHAFAPAARLERRNSGTLAAIRADEDRARVALSSEGLRTTTRMMHGMAWLLNHRAYFMGEINQMQLYRHGRLAAERRQSDAAQAALLSPETGELVERTQRFYERLLRLDDSWRLTAPVSTSAIERLRERIEQRLVG